MAKKRVSKTRPKAKVTVKKPEAKTVPAKTEFLLYDASLGSWVWSETYDTEEEADKEVAQSLIPALVVKVELPEVKY